MSRAPRLLIFDLGDVLVHVDQPGFLQALASATGLTPEAVAQVVDDTQLLGSFELGQLTPRQFFDAVQTALRAPWSFDQFVTAWNGMLSERREHTRLLSRLRSQYHIMALSNTNVLHDTHLRTWAFTTQFHHWITSYQVGRRKPDPELYRLALARAATPPEAAVYCDDRQPMVEAARALGMTAIHVTPTLNLEQALRDAGVVWAEAD